MKEDSFLGVLGCDFPARERVGVLRPWKGVGASWWPLLGQHPQPDSPMSRDEEDAAIPEKARPSPPTSKLSNPFLQLAQDPTVPTYKQGILARKMHHDADGKKSECLLPCCLVGAPVCQWTGWGGCGEERLSSATRADVCMGVQRWHS